MLRLQPRFLALFLVLLALEVGIARYIHSGPVRAFVGDVLVVPTLFFLLRGCVQLPVALAAGLVLGFAGVVVLLRPSVGGGQEWPALVGLLGGFFAGWAYMQVRELSLMGEPGWRVVFYLSLVGMAMSALWATATGWHSLSWQAAPYLFGIGASALVAQLCLTRAYKVGDKLTVAALSYLTVVFSTFAGMWLWGDSIGWQEMLGMGMIIASGMLSGVHPQQWLHYFKTKH